jgi:putative oxidoreductase
MKIVTLIARLLLGLVFVVFGLNGLHSFIPQPPMPQGPALQFILALSATHYVHVIFVIQLVAGILFLINRYVPLALTIIAPVIVNILLFHGFMAPSGIVPGALVTLFWIIVFISVRSAFAGIFQQKVEG